MARTADVVKELQSRLDKDGETWVKLRTLVHLAGQENLSSKLVTEIELALEGAGIHHSPSDLGICSPSDTVLMSTAPFHDSGLPFESEKDLEGFIERHYRLLPPFSRCRSVDRQARCGDLKIDLLFTEADGSLVVCELKHGNGRFGTASQIHCYIEAVRTSVATKKKPPKIRGVVITGEPNPDQEDEVIRWCRESNIKVDWYYYRLGLALTLAAPQPSDEIAVAL